MLNKPHLNTDPDSSFLKINTFESKYNVLWSQAAFGISAIPLPTPQEYVKDVFIPLFACLP